VLEDRHRARRLAALERHVSHARLDAPSSSASSHPSLPPSAAPLRTTRATREVAPRELIASEREVI